MLLADAQQQHGTGFKVDEWLEALLRCRDEQPCRYARVVSPGLQVQVERYAARKSDYDRRKAA